MKKVFNTLKKGFCIHRNVISRKSYRYCLHCGMRLHPLSILRKL